MLQGMRITPRANICPDETRCQGKRVDKKLLLGGRAASAPAYKRSQSQAGVNWMASVFRTVR